MSTLSASDITDLQHQFRRCSAPTVEAILRFRGSPSATEVPVILRGMMERYLRGPAREKFGEALPETALAALGLESLTLLEIILDAQDALGIEISDEELRPIKTFGDVQNLLLSKIPAPPAA